MKETTYAKIFYIIFTFVVCVLISCIVQYELSKKEVTIEGTVTNTVFHKDYMTVTFSNNDTYNVAYESYNFGYADFTVNSKMNIKLEYSSFWMCPNNDNVWGISHIVKVPK